MGVDKSNPRRTANAIAVDGEAGWPGWVDSLAVRRLQEAIRSERIGHAYLVSGPPGVGKTATAQAFAQALCCTDQARSDPATPCGLCRACRNVQRGVHPDVESFSLDTQAMLADKPGGASALSIDTVRRLRSAGALFPLESNRRILIVDDAETMLEAAQQALLKTLEEPPLAVTLILLADEPDSLLETVRSRCQEVPIRPIPQAVVADTLLRRGVQGPLASEIAMLSRGSAGWALAAVADKKVLDARREERASAARWIASPRYEQLVTAFKFGDQFSKRRSEVIGIVQAAIQLLRDDMIAAAQAAGQATERSPESSMAAQLTLSLSRAIAATLQCLSDLDSNVRPRLALEAMVVAWPNSELQGL